MSLGNSKKSIGGRNAYFKSGGLAGAVPAIITDPLATAAAAIVSQSASVTNGTWTGSPTSYTYQLQRSTNGGASYSDITGTSNSYNFLAADASFLVRWKVTASNAFGASLPAYSNAISVLATPLDMANANNGATAAQATSAARLLRGAHYGSPIIRLRRSGDNAESDFGVDSNGNLNLASALAFCVAGGGSQNGFLVRKYDQSGNGRDDIQTTPANQLQFITGGALTATFGTNSRPAETYNGSTTFYTIGAPTPLFTFTGAGTAFIPHRPTSTINQGYGGFIFQGPASSLSNNGLMLMCQRFDTVTQFVQYGGDSYARQLWWNAVTRTLNQRYMLTLRWTNWSTANTNGQSVVRVDGVDQSVSLGGSAPVGLGSAVMFKGKSDVSTTTISVLRAVTPEMIIYASDQAANYSIIENNINSYYGIY